MTGSIFCRLWGSTLSIGVSLLMALQLSPLYGQLPTLKVSENQRFLVKEDGSPFFYLGDTAWELFHRLNREQADQYLSKRSEQGFTVIQAVALAELDGLGVPNAYGHLPLIDCDPAKPATIDGEANDYWDHVDYIVHRANELGMYVGLLPTWGDKWNQKWGVGPEVFTAENAAAYGQWIGNRYRDAGVIWILGGDRPIENEQHRQIIEAMAAGIGRGDGGRNLRTFHPTGGQGSSQYFHDASWLDFNMRQNGHVVNFAGNHEKTRVDYDLKPIKPVIDGEPIYEDHPIAFKANENGHSLAADARRAMYWDLFSGAFGHTYGHHSVWQMWEAGRAPVNGPLLSWSEALDQAGAAQMRFGRMLMLSRPFLTRIPDDSIIVPHSVATAIPGAGRLRVVATRDRDGSYAMIYLPGGRPVDVKLSGIGKSKVVAWWYNPRTGEATREGEYSNQGTQRFTSPDPGEYLDWVLVLDDAAADFATPGQPSQY